MNKEDFKSFCENYVRIALTRCRADMLCESRNEIKVYDKKLASLMEKVNIAEMNMVDHLLSHGIQVPQ